MTRAQFIVLVAATTAAIVYYLRFDRYKPDHDENTCNDVKYYYHDQLIDEFVDEEDL